MSSSTAAAAGLGGQGAHSEEVALILLLMKFLHLLHCATLYLQWRILSNLITRRPFSHD